MTGSALPGYSKPTDFSNPRLPFSCPAAESRHWDCWWPPARWCPFRCPGWSGAAQAMARAESVAVPWSWVAPAEAASRPGAVFPGWRTTPEHWYCPHWLEWSRSAGYRDLIDFPPHAFRSQSWPAGRAGERWGWFSWVLMIPGFGLIFVAGRALEDHCHAEDDCPAAAQQQPEGAVGRKSGQDL